MTRTYKRRMRVWRDPLRDQPCANFSEPLPVPGLPETQRHRARVLSDLRAARRHEDRGRGAFMAGRGRQRHRQVPRLLPELRHAGLPDFAAMPELIVVHATSLDDPGQFEPQALTYSFRGHGWDLIDPSLQAFERMPG